jgi:UDP-glucuronate decarboxylase
MTKASGPVNVGNPDEFSIRELAELVLELTKSKSQLVYEPLPADDPVRRRPDITLAERHLKWTPRISLRKGLPTLSKCTQIKSKSGRFGLKRFRLSQR